MEALRQGVRDGNERAIAMTGEVLGFLKKGGIQINNNLNQTSETTTVIAGPSFDTVVRRMAEQRRSAGSSPAVITGTAQSVIESGDK